MQKRNAGAGLTPQGSGEKSGVFGVSVETAGQWPHLTLEGKLRVRLTSERYANYPCGDVLDASGRVIGEASSYTYGGCAFAVHTPAFAGHVAFDQCAFVGDLRGILGGAK